MTLIASSVLGDWASCRAEPGLGPQFHGLLHSYSIPIPYIIFFSLSTPPPSFPLCSPSHMHAILWYSMCSLLQNQSEAM